jgi:anti-anti-sigma factor
MAKTFNPSIEERQGCLWITFKESIDMDNYKTIEDSVSRNMMDSNLQKVVIDLSKTAALFSSGLGLIMRMHLLAKKNNKKIYIVNASDRMREGLETMNLDKILSIYPSTEAFESEQEKTNG